MASSLIDQVVVGSIILARPIHYGPNGRITHPLHRFRVTAVHTTYVIGVLCSKRGILFKTLKVLKPSEIVKIEYLHDPLAQFALKDAVVPIGTERARNFEAEINKAERKVAAAEKMISVGNGIIIDQQRLIAKIRKENNAE